MLSPLLIFLDQGVTTNSIRALKITATKQLLLLVSLFTRFF